MRVFGFAGWSGSGKTTLIERVIPLLVAADMRVALIKHAHHSFDLDQPGKDSWRHRQAGAGQVLISSDRRFALMHELHDEAEMTLDRLLGRLSPCDLVLVEGYKTAPIPKLEVWRDSVGKALLHPADPHIIGIASDSPALFANGPIPSFALEDVQAIATFVRESAAVLRGLD
jgi:molybdopterin-guanine dinucleotide biosynthesis protein B